MTIHIMLTDEMRINALFVTDGWTKVLPTTEDIYHTLISVLTLSLIKKCLGYMFVVLISKSSKLFSFLEWHLA